MASPLYSQLQPQNGFTNMLAQLKQNPVAVLGKKYNIPQGMNNPNDILQHLLNTQQVSQSQVDQIMRMKNDPQIQKLFK
jgi:hypothetical protein